MISSRAGSHPGPDATSHFSAWSMATRPSTGTAAATSSRPGPRPCGGSRRPRPPQAEPPRGGDRVRIEIEPLEIPEPDVPDDLLALDDALTEFVAVDPQAAELVKLRYFAGFTIRQAAEVLGVSPRTAELIWAYAKAWLLEKVRGEDPPTPRDGTAPRNS